MTTAHADSTAAQLDELRSLRRELAELRARVDAVEAMSGRSAEYRTNGLAEDHPGSHGGLDGQPQADHGARREEPKRLSRRWLLKSAGVAAAAAAGVYMAGGAASPHVAEAADGDPLTAGNTVTSSAPTTLAVTQQGDDTGTIYGFGVTDTDFEQFPESASLAGHTNTTYATGVLGYDQDSNVGVVGISEGGTGVAGSGKAIGLFGVTPHKGVGVLGFSGVSLATPFQATGEFGVVGLTAGVASVSAGVAAGTISPTGQAAALVGESNGFGPGLDVTSKKGRGIISQSALAQLRLMPSGKKTHPPSGARGDLFVDEKARLWYCKSGGPHAKWVRLA